MLFYKELDLVRKSKSDLVASIEFRLTNIENKSLKKKYF